MASCSDFFISASPEASISVEGYTVILPTVSVGNVAQLTVDLLVNTLHMELYGWFNDDCILPVVGNRVFDHLPSISLTTSAELYVCPEKRLLVIQLRSPCSKGNSKQFVDRILEWFNANKLSQMIVLTSLYAEERQDKHLLSSPFRFLLSTKSKHLYEYFTTKLHWSPMEPRQLSSHDNLTGVLHERDLFLPGSGFAKYIYKKSDLGLIMVAMFCGQGNNCPDAISLATHINKWINVVDESNVKKGGSSLWTLPQSWKCLYGNPHPKSLY